MVNCPFCRHKLDFVEKVDELIKFKSVHMSMYRCLECRIPFKRISMKNKLGLIKHDILYDLDKDGNYMRSWD